MTETATLNGQPQKLLEEKLLTLEAKFAALEKGYQDLYNKSFPFTEPESTSPSIRTFTSQVYDTTGNANNLASENRLILQLSASKEVKERTEVS